MIPTEHELTVAVDAAAMFVYDQATGGQDAPAFADLDVMRQLRVRESVLPVVNVAVAAIPDRRATFVAALEEISASLSRAISEDGDVVADLQLIGHRVDVLVHRIHEETA